MKKTHSTNIGGTIFQVEDDAYQRLHAYLESVAAYFQSYPDAKDIVADIEGRIAEQLLQKGGVPRIVALEDVEQVIIAMGNVDQFGDTEIADAHAPPLSATPVAPASPPGLGQRRLFRDRETGVVGGVAAGIAAYFDVSPFRIRLLFFLAALFLGGTGLFVYLVLWLCVPAARTMTDRLRMRGQPVTLAAIEQEARDQATAPPRRWGGARILLRVMLVGAAILFLVCLATWLMTCCGVDCAVSHWTYTNGVSYTSGTDKTPPRVHLDTLVPVQGTPTIDLSTIEGDIHVTTWAHPQVKVVVRAWGNAGVDFGVSGTRIHLKETLKTPTCWQCHVMYDVTVPVGASLVTESVSGAQRIVGTHGTLRANSVSGDLEIEDASPVAARTVSGDIALIVPTTAHATVMVQSTSGTISNDFPSGAGADDDEDGGERQLVVPVNGGGGALVAHSVSGDISIRKAATK